MKKDRKWILVTALFLSIAILGLFLFDYFSPPRWSQAEKERVKQAYVQWSNINKEKALEGWEEKWLNNHPMIWYDENGNVEENNVWRYIGTYGDCYAFLLIGKDVNVMMPTDDYPIPYPLVGLSHTVYYPTIATVVLYDAKGNLPTYKDVNGDPSLLLPLYQIEDKNWLTDEQLEQLTQDIEKIAEDFKTST